MIASERGHTPCVEALLKAGADMEAEDEVRQWEPAETPKAAARCLLTPSTAARVAALGRPAAPLHAPLQCAPRLV